MYQAVANIPRSQYTTEEQVVIRAIPDLENDRNDISRRTIYECAKRQIEAFQNSRISSLKPESYIEQILDDLCCFSRENLYFRNKANAYQVLFAMCILLRSSICELNRESCFADNIHELMENTIYFSEFVYKIDNAVRDLRGEEIESEVQISNTPKQYFSSTTNPSVKQYNIYINAPVENLYANIEQLTNQNNYE